MTLPMVSFKNTSPTFPVRGFMLDVSRDKVPTQTELKRRIDLAAELGINQFQLYIEHTFAYRGHETVWRDASPLTGEEIRELDVYCRERGVDLVPNQNSFGHMERWLKHDAYAHLAEDPVRRLTLCPIDPGSIELMRDLYGQLLPNFSSKYFNIGCDETWELGEGRSRAECQRIGKGRVYLNYLLKLFEIVREHGKTPMFWGDIILKYPELIPELPKDAIALQWGYAHDEPREADSRKFAEAGIPFYVCPGTSSWNSIIGRAEDLLPNQANAVRLAKEYGASGYLITEWGDNGHWQPWEVGQLGLIAGAAAAWTGRALEPDELERAAGTFVFGKEAAGAGLLALEQAQAAAGVKVHNRSIAHILLQQPADSLPAGFHLSGLAEVEARIEAARGIWQEQASHAELDHAVALALHACRLGRARIKAGGPVASIAAVERRVLCKELRRLVDEFRQLWLERNRPGGLEESVRRFEPLLALYDAK